MTVSQGVIQKGRHLLDDQRGGSAVEFALILPVLLLLIVAIMQIALILFAGQHLENATATLGRLIRTGQAQGLNLSQATFRTELCKEIAPVLRCESGNFYVDVRTLPDFGSVPLTWPIDDNGEFTGTGTFQPGGAGEIVVVRTFYRFPVLLPMIGPILSNGGGGMRVLSSAAVFRNEPF